MLGTTQKGLYEKVTINRKTKTVDIDRMDGNWWHDEPFIGRRDHFYIEDREGTSHADGQLTFVRHDFWLPFYAKFGAQFGSNFSKMAYGRAFSSTAAN